MLNMHHELVCDSSSLILLIKSDLVIYTLERNIIVIPKSVYDETVAIGKSKGYEDSYIIEKYVRESKIKIVEPTTKTKRDVEKLCNLHLGERDVISLAIDKKLKVLCDDKKGRNACEVFGIETITVLNILDRLYTQRKINKKNALSILTKLERYGWYKNELIMHLRDGIEGG